jgi:mRNA interferase RelE/StbE
LAYRIEIDRRALRSLKRLPNDARKRLVAAIDELAAEPRPGGVTKLTGREEWRVRIGDYRVIYTIDDTQQTVTVWKAGHRKDVYRR